MAPPKQLTTLLIFVVSFTPQFVVSQSQYQQPYQPFFNYQPHRFQQNTYQPFTNAPYYQPTFQTHAPESRPNLLNNFFGDLTSPTPPAPPSNPLVTFPTQVSSVSGAPSSGQQTYQPFGNGLFQQPTVPSTTLSDPFRPSPLINHHTHIVNGLPRQQFFGNNYEFFRQRHGLNIPGASPFLSNAGTTPAPTFPPPTPSILLSPTSTAQPASKPVEVNPSTVKTIGTSPKPTQPTIVSRFPPFSPLPSFSSVSSNSIQATTPTPRLAPTAQPTRPSPTSGVSPAFTFSQYYADGDSNGSNELVRSPLFGEEEEEEVDDDDGKYTLNNSNNIYDQRQQQPIPHQRSAASPPSVASSVPYKPQPFNNIFSNVNTLNSQSKDEPGPIRIHNTTPIRIVFNYEQALEALQENPGVRVVVAQTERNNFTDEYSTPRPVVQPYSVTSSKPLPSPYFQTTTDRPPLTATHRPTAISSTQRPIPTRFDYQPGNYYQPPVTGRTTTTAAALENLALELEGRYANSGRQISNLPLPTPRPSVYDSVLPYATEPPIPRPSVYDSVNQYATEPPTENPLVTYRRGPKKYVMVQGGNVFKSQEPRVVVNDLANIVVQTLSPGSRPFSATSPTFLAFPTRPSFTQFDDDNDEDDVGEPVGEDLQKEIENLSQQLDIATTLPSSTTTPSPPPRIRVTTTAPRLLKITTYRPPGTYRTTPRQAPRVVEEEEESIDEIPENNLTQEPPVSQSPRYYYNNKQRGGISGAYQRYEYNGVDGPSSGTQPDEEKPRRRQRVRGRLIAGSPPRPVQVSGPGGPGPLLHVMGPGSGAFQVGPVPIGGQAPGTPVNGAAPVYRVGPRGRLLRRKIRPRTQPTSSTTPAQETQQSSLSPSPTSPSAVPDLPPVFQDISSEGPPIFPPYSPSPFIPTSVPFPVTTFRPGAGLPSYVVRQNIASNDQEEEDRRVDDKPQTFRSRFRFQPSKATTTTTRTVEEEEDDASNQYESEEEAPVPQRRRPNFSTTTTEKPSTREVSSDRANILQRQIRFNRNRKNQNQNQKNSS